LELLLFTYNKSKYADLNDIQSVALFAFWYDSEVQNGGHLQYFENKFKHFQNREQLLITTTLKALKILAAKEQSDILTAASEKYFIASKKTSHKYRGFLYT